MYAYLNDILYPDALVFDIGAHIGKMTSVFLSHKCRVVAVEPLHQYASQINKNFPAATLIEAAISPDPSLIIHESGTLSTAVPKTWWKGRFSHIKSNRVVTVSTRTLDSLIEEFGTPTYIKIDTEGYDDTVLRTLTTHVPYLSFEFESEQIDSYQRTLNYLTSLDYNAFNLLIGSLQPLSPDYLSLFDFTHAITRTVKDRPAVWGDILCAHIP